MNQISSKIVKARKVHGCDFCFGKIQIGEKYRTQFNQYDGYVYSWKNHIRCEEIASELKMYDECYEGLSSDLFQEYIREEFIKLQEQYNSEVFNYENYKYPSFDEQLNYVCEIKLKNE